MGETYFKSADELKEAFDLDEAIYTDYIPITETKVGFSVLRKYPDNIRFKPPKLKSGEDDVVAVLQVGYYPRIEKGLKVSNRTPLFLRIFSLSKYLRSHSDYEFERDDCPTEESVLLSKTTPRPLDLEDTDGYFYDHNIKEFCDREGNSLRGMDILDGLFKEHCDTVRLIKGLKIQLKLGMHSKLISFLDIIIQLFKWLLKYFFGRTIKSNNTGAGLLEPYQEGDMILTKTDSIELFGYKASRPVIITFSILVIVAYAIYHFAELKSPFLHTIATNNLLSICFSVSALVILDKMIPNILFGIMNGILKLKLKLIYLKFKA